VLGPQVRDAIARSIAHLDLWGYDAQRQRWALLVWDDYASRGLTRPVTVLCSGWLHAADVHPVDGVDYGQVWRARLGPNPPTWPRPSTGSDLHYGQLSRYQRLDPPLGMTWIATRPRRRPRIPRCEQAGPEDRRQA
jgi:hypothetical protein